MTRSTPAFLCMTAHITSCGVEIGQSLARSGLNRNLYDSIGSLLEKLVRFHDVVQRKFMGEQVPQVYTVSPHQFHQPTHSFLPSRTECRDNFLVADTRQKGLQRNRELPGIHPQTRKSSGWFQTAQRVLKRLLGPKRLDGNIDS